jgi:hypothetical protein
VKLESGYSLRRPDRHYGDHGARVVAAGFRMKSLPSGLMMPRRREKSVEMLPVSSSVSDRDAAIQAAISAGIAAIGAFLIDQPGDAVKNWRDYKHRWDRDLSDCVQELVSTSRRLAHFVSDGVSRDDIALSHVAVRIAAHRLLVMANKEVSQCALQLQHETFAFVQISEGQADPRPTDNDPNERYWESVPDPYVAL